MKHLAETLHELNKEKKKSKSEYPQCSNCNNAMVWSFAFIGCEWVCLPCDYAVPMFNGLKKIYRNDEAMADKKRKWQEELSVIARRHGGGSCGVDGCKNGSCKLCKKTADKNYKFKIWKSNLTPNNVSKE